MMAENAVNVESLARDHSFERFAIIAALDNLAHNVPIEQVTVGAICEKAQISRTTFYRLFNDKYDAANWFAFCVLEVGNMLTGRNYSWYDGNVVTLSGCLLMRDLMISAWSSPGYHALIEAGIRRRKQDLIDSVVIWKHAELTDKLLFQIDCFAYLESYMARTWIAENEPRSVEEMSSYIESCVPKDLYDLLNDPVDPKPGKMLTASSMILAIV